MAAKSVPQPKFVNQRRCSRQLFKKAWGRNTLIYLFFIGSIHGLYGQTFFQSLPEGLGNATLNGQPEDLSNFFTISADEDQDGIVRVKLKREDEDAVAFSLSPFTYDLFKLKLVTALNAQQSNIAGATDVDVDGEAEIAQLFAEIVSRFNVVNTRPEIATIYLKKLIPVYFNNEELPQFFLKNAKTEIAFYDGFIEKIELTGEFDDQTIQFNNYYSIGISSLKNVEAFSLVRLAANREFYTYQRTGLQPEDTSLHLTPFNGSAIFPGMKISGERKNLYVNLGDVLGYDPVVDVNANDISPIDSRVILDQNQLSVPLYKEETKKILEAVVYSDFFGVFDDENPNGIIQTEIRKKFNLNTKRRDAADIIKWLGNGYGVLEYFELDFRMAKLEENNRFLEAETKVSIDNAMDSVPAFDLLSTFQYQNFYFGGNFNFLTLEKQASKTKFTIDAGFGFGRSGVRIEEKENNLNTLQFPITTTLRIAPEKRYGLEISGEARYLRVLSNEKFEIQTVKDGEDVKSSEWLNQWSLLGYLNVSERGKLFVRYGLVFELGNINDNFSMFQFGYSFYVLGRNSKK